MKGEKGTPGVTGKPGMKGNKGDSGVMGAQGQKGMKGTQGIKGQKGDEGKCDAQVGCYPILGIFHPWNDFLAISFRNHSSAIFEWEKHRRL